MRIEKKLPASMYDVFTFTSLYRMMSTPWKESIQPDNWYFSKKKLTMVTIYVDHMTGFFQVKKAAPYLMRQCCYFVYK